MLSRSARARRVSKDKHLHRVILLWGDNFRLLADSMFGPIYAIYVEEIGGDAINVGWSMGLYMGAIAISTYFFSRYIDKIHNKRLFIAGGYFMQGTIYAFFPLVGTIAGLYLFQILLGLSYAMSQPAFEGLYSDNLDDAKSASEWGNWEITTSISYMIGAIAGGYLATIYGFEVLFYVIAFISIVGAAVVMKKMK